MSRAAQASSLGVMVRFLEELGASIARGSPAERNLRAGLFQAAFGQVEVPGVWSATQRPVRVSLEMCEEADTQGAH